MSKFQVEKVPYKNGRSRNLYINTAMNCKTFDICGIKFSRFNETDILAEINFGVYNIPWFQITIDVSLFGLSYFSIDLCTVAPITIASSRRF